MLWCRDSYSNPDLMVLEGWLFLEFPLSPFLFSFCIVSIVFHFCHIGIFSKFLCKINIIAFLQLLACDVSKSLKTYQVCLALFDQHIYCFAKATWLRSVHSITCVEYLNVELQQECQNIFAFKNATPKSYLEIRTPA